MLKNFKIKKGFTLVELIIVIAIIGILSAVLVPTMIGVVGQANASKAGQELANDGKLLSVDLQNSIIEGEDLTGFAKRVGENKEIHNDIVFLAVASEKDVLSITPEDLVKGRKIVFVEVKDNELKRVLGGISVIKNMGVKAEKHTYGSFGIVPTINVVEGASNTFIAIPSGGVNG